MKPFAEVASDPTLPSSVLATIELLSGRTDFMVVLIIVSDEGQSMLNNILDRGKLAEVLEQAAAKARTSDPDESVKAQLGN